MIKRVIDISEQAYLHQLHQQLVIDKNGKTVAQIPIEDLGVLILQHPAIVITQAVVISCQQNNAAIVFCDARHLPYSVLLPISDGNSLHSKIIRQQISLSLPAKKRVWQQIVKHKISGQAQVLKHVGKNPLPLKRLAENVKAGDPENLEAQAAQKYWRLLFGDGFRRDTDAEGINSLLNYGYGIMRAMVARAIVASGLHPALGVQHSNQYDGLCLADDVMEPFRPWVDLRVYQLSQQYPALEVNQTTKLPFLKLLSESVCWNQQTMPLMVASHYLMADIKRAFDDKNQKINYPEWGELLL
ncbi:type II CRISPR-associated endonuclease Cas1 [Methylovulum miyakonense]|uniref:type II CRISPR-associated endonuclease Cas1 n=1 Tax=Methylovulum miyakonense TaxID=645578 RepID=UPI00036DD1B2|nr:type II CRISPR-associated endonuclease Cas1 [Methylovulum miyakonense]